jgi:amidophosphoribosyltransferase
VFDDSVYLTRKKFGARLALEHPVDADVVAPVPDSGTYAALGFAEAAGISFDISIMRNHYIGRTFIKPSPDDRKTAVNMKLNPIREAVEGKSVCLVEDSIVRGNTSRERVRALRESGAREVHMRISCPPHKHPCFYGIDFPSAEELIAYSHSLEEIAETIGADSLAYLSLEGMLSCVSEPNENYCHACFSGNYPVPVTPP